jgi:hypothetical protein
MSPVEDVLKGFVMVQFRARMHRSAPHSAGEGGAPA